MSWLIPIGYGVVSAIGFFIYLCWFRHVRDTVPSRAGKLLYYFLIALSFVLLGRLTGIVMAVGVVPMLIILLFLPKTGYSLAVKLSVIYGLAVCFVYYGTAAEERQALSHSQATLFNDYTPPFDFGKYFKYENATVEPIEYEMHKIMFDDFSLVVPVPIGYKLTNMSEQRGEKILYGIIIVKHEHDFMGITIQRKSIETHKNRFEDFKKEIYTTAFDPGFLSSLKKELDNDEGVLLAQSHPFVMQNTPDSFAVFYPLILERKNENQHYVSGYTFGSIRINQEILTIIGLSQTIPPGSDAHHASSWLNMLVQVNSTTTG